MANDSTNAGQVSSEQDTTPINDGYFTDMQGDGDAFFGPEQLAQASAGGAPVVVPVPQDQNVIRVQVSPGEIIELSSPFDGGVALLGREADGNLAIRVGDVTVILVGFVEANAAAPVVVETSDGQPVDIAVLLASTDPAIDIQTAAGPGDAAQGGQGADNTGGLLTQFGEGTGLGGLNAVGGQDATQLSYGLIDNSIRLDRDDALATTTGTSFKGLAEPFLRDPFNDTTFNDFTTFFTNYKTDVNGNPGDAWADFTGTAANGVDFESYLEQTSFTNLVTHTSDISEPLYIDVNALTPIIEAMTSDQHHLYIDPATVDMSGHATTVFVRRDGDDALIMVIHAHAASTDLADDTQGSSGNYQIDSYLINRLDHPDAGQDILDLNIPFVIPHPASGGGEGSEEQPQEIPPTTGIVQVQIQDDIPIVGETDYYSFLHASSYKDALSCFDFLTHGKVSDFISVTHDAGQVDEDYIFGGNRDKDNAAGPDKDDARGDTIGDRFVVGQLHVNFGADGASGKIPQGDWPSKTNPIFTDANPQALHIDGYEEGSKVPGLTSHGHELFVLTHETIGTIEVLQVGYKLTNDTPSGEGTAARTLTDTGSCDVVVFTLLLQTGPNLPLIPFGGFVFDQSGPLDHPVAGTLESNLQLLFPITATDDDGDHPVDPLNIVININDDAPTFQITYTNEDPTNCERGDGPVTEGFALTGLPTTHVDHYTTKDFGHVDEDWLNGGVRKEALVAANGQGNHDLDGNGDVNANEFGDDRGGVQVCGQIKVKYGADGPSDAENNGDLALKTYDTTDPQNLPLFVNGGDPTPLTSDGHPLVVLQSSPGHLLVGYTETYVQGVDGTSESYTTNHPVFELCLNPSTGKFEFNLLAPIDHLPSTVDGEPESNLVLSFDVGAAEDFDGDKALGAINIKVNDDKPEVGITYCNETPGAIPHIFAVGTSHDTDFGRIDEDWLTTAQSVHGIPNGSFENPVVLGNFDTLGGPNGIDGWTISGVGVDLIHNYWPASQGDQSVDMNSTGAGSISKVLTGLEIGREYTISFDLSGNPELDPGVKSLKVEVGSVYSNTFDSEDTSGHNFTNMVWTKQSFTFVATSDTETLTFTSLEDGPCGPVLDNVTMVRNEYITGNQDQYADGTSNANLFGDDYGSNHLSGQITVKYGADGAAGTDAPFGLKVYEDLTLTGPLYENPDGQNFKSGGKDLIVLESDSGHLLVGIAGQIIPGGGEGGSTLFIPAIKIFELDFTAGDGKFDFKLWGPIDHDPQAGPDGVESNLLLNFNVGSVSDKDGDVADAVIKIQINDDSPETSISYTSHADTSEDGDFTSATFGSVDEDFLGDPPANTDNDNNPFAHEDAARGDTLGTNSCYGSIGTTNFGGDGPGDTGSTFALAHLSGDFKDAEGNPVTQGGQTLVVLDSTDGHLAVGHAGGSPVFELNLNGDGTFNFQLYGPLDQTPGNTDPIENNLMLAFDAGNGATDGDGDPVAAVIKIQVNDDAPVAVDQTVDFSAPNPITGNVFDQAKQGADGARITLVNGIAIAAGDSHTFIGSDNSQMVIFANGSWSFTPGEDENGRPSDRTFTYTITDGDGDSVTKDLVLNYTGNDGARLAFAPSGPTHEPAPHYDHDVTVTGLGLNGIALNNQTHHFEDPTGGHVISGGGGNDYINVTGNKDTPSLFGVGGLNGNGGDDIIHGGGGKDLIHGGAGDDTIYGGNNDDDLYGDSGHDAMDGGAGNDKIHVDADDLDGTNTFDGVHSIDGGDGIDKVDLSVLKTFDSGQAMHLENVEILAFDGKATGGGGTAVTLSYDAAYGVTQVGGLHTLSISGDKSDTLHLEASNGNAWHATGNANEYAAGVGSATVTVQVDADMTVQVS